MEIDISLPAGMRPRGFAGPSDYPKMVGLINACNEFDGLEERTTVEEIEVRYRNLDRSFPETDMVMVDVAGELVGYTRADWWVETSGPRVSLVFAAVRPQFRSQEVIGALLDWAEMRCSEIAGPDLSSEKVFEGYAQLGSQPEMIAAYEARGFRPVAHEAEMVRPHLEDIPDARLPDGIEIRPVAQEHFRDIWLANRAAFRDHWGNPESTDADYARFLEDPYFDPSLWKIAWAGDRVAGQVRSFIKPDENRIHGRKRGYTEYISTVREFRRQGIARSLICASFEELRLRGMTEAALGVHTENPNGAFSLYEGLGFVVTNRSVIFRKPF